ncbi:histone-lysine N-methyltransferase SETD2 [Lepeophtheirus salmonis]|uniref:histone-lysine N-methyltransferase SETD2 n=1 Tax=Lepeophtheirus salmonis TaxID=72036 RepID=UPI003AF37BDF
MKRSENAPAASPGGMVLRRRSKTLITDELKAPVRKRGLSLTRPPKAPKKPRQMSLEEEKDPDQDQDSDSSHLQVMAISIHRTEIPTPRIPPPPNQNNEVKHPDEEPSLISGATRRTRRSNSLTPVIGASKKTLGLNRRVNIPKKEDLQQHSTTNTTNHMTQTSALELTKKEDALDEKKTCEDTNSDNTTSSEDSEIQGTDKHICSEDTSELTQSVSNILTHNPKDSTPTHSVSQSDLNTEDSQNSNEPSENSLKLDSDMSFKILDTNKGGSVNVKTDEYLHNSEKSNINLTNVSDFSKEKLNHNSNEPKLQNNILETLNVSTHSSLVKTKPGNHIDSSTHFSNLRVKSPPISTGECDYKCDLENVKLKQKDEDTSGKTVKYDGPSLSPSKSEKETQCTEWKSQNIYSLCDLERNTKLIDRNISHNSNDHTQLCLNNHDDIEYDVRSPKTTQDTSIIKQEPTTDVTVPSCDSNVPQELSSITKEEVTEPLVSSNVSTILPSKTKRTRCKQKSTASKEDGESDPIPVKRSLRSMTISNANQNSNVPSPKTENEDSGKAMSTILKKESAPVKRKYRRRKVVNQNIEGQKDIKGKKPGRKPRARNLKRPLNKNTTKNSYKSSAKIKSVSEVYNNAASDHSSDEPLVPLNGSKALTNDTIQNAVIADLKDPQAVKEEIKQRLSSFEHIKENIFICERRSNKQSRGMECDCSLTKEEISLNKRGCGENCLNRLLKIECSKLCSLGKLCGNKKFQSSDNAPVEVFKTNCKGFGIRATANIPGDTFIMEYVGEVLDAKQFRKRAKRYAKEDVRHFYFMALSTENCIDAGSKGNISRFINHSCSPNSETQKWMVDGGMRIGFFTKRKVSSGEEITFDYKYERYGQEAQECLCEAENCRGWLGGEPLKGGEDVEEEDEDDLEEDDYWSSSEEECQPDEEPRALSPLAPLEHSVVVEETSKNDEEEQKDMDFVLHQQNVDISEEDKTIVPTEVVPAPKKRRRRRRSPRKIKNYEDVEDEDEIEKLKSTGIRTKNHTVELSRIMVRTTDTYSRSILAELLQNADTPCKRLFMDYYGLRILYGWMSENVWTDLRELDLKIQILNILVLLGIPHKTMLVDCKIWSLVSAWACGKLGEASEDNSELNSGYTSPVNNELLTNDLQQSLPSCNSLKKENITLDNEKVESDNDPSSSTASSIEDIDSLKLEELNKTANNVVDSPIKEEKDDKVIQSSEDKDLHKTFSDQPTLKEEVFQADIQPITKATPSLDDDISKKSNEEIDNRCKLIIEKSSTLIDSWKSLKEVFKIPKKDRIALRAEHEREADQAASQIPSTPVINSSVPSVRNAITTIITNNACVTIPQGSTPSANGNLLIKNSGYFANRTPEPTVSKRLCSRWDDRSGKLHRNKISREERRQLFALRVKQQEEEKKKRELLLEHHRNKCFYLNLPSDETPMFPHYPDFVFNPEDGNWYQMPEPYPRVNVTWGYATMAELPSEAYQGGDEPLPNRAYLYPPGVVPVSYLYGIPLTTPEDYYKQLELQQQPPSIPNSEIDSSQFPEQVPMETVRKSPCSNNTGLSKLKRPDEVPKLESSENFTNVSSSPTPFHLEHSNEVMSEPLETLDPSVPKQTTELPVSITKSSTVSSSSTSKKQRAEIIIKLPPKWKMALDPNGRPYFYNLFTKCTQWEPPSHSAEDKSESDVGESADVVEIDTLSTDSDEDNGEEEGEESDEDDDDESDEENSAPTSGNQSECRVDEMASDLSGKEKEILLQLPKKKTKEERQHERRQKRERDREKTRIKKDFKIGKKHQLNERLSVNRDIQDKKSINSNNNDTSSVSGGSSALSTSALPSTFDSDKEKKYKDRFLKETSKVIVKVLDPYRRSDAPNGQIKSVEDFKHLARKLTNFVMTKELKHCPKIEDLKCSESVKKKAAEFVKKYMSKFGDVYKRSPQPGM